MSTKLSDKLKQLPKERQKKIDERAKQLALEEMSLRDLRNALELTQEAIARELHIRQDGVSRLEQRTDLLLSTLQHYVAAMGGDLSLVVEFPNRPPVKLHGLGDMNIAT